MAFNEFAFNTKRDEIACIGSKTTPLTAGIAVKITELAKGVSGTDIYQKIEVAVKGDDIFGVVTAAPVTTRITDKQFGQVVMKNARILPVLMNKTAMKGDLIFVATADGKWEKAATGDRAQAQLIEDVATAGDLAWAVPLDRIV